MNRYKGEKRNLNKIFDYNVDIDKTAYLNWRTYNHQLLHDMIVIADGYMQSAIMLSKDCIEDNSDKKADVIIFPILFSINHAIELYLKTISWSLALLQNRARECKNCHDIKQIWENVSKQVNEFELDKERKKQFKELTKELKSYINELYDHIDKEHNANKKMRNMDFSRYPLNSNDDYHFYITSYGNAVVNLEAVANTFSIIGSNLSNIASDYEQKATFVPD